VTLRPDTKDWTWVLEHPCAECGFDPAATAPAEVAGLLRGSSAAFATALAAPEAGERTHADHWSVLEYSCHVRDVHRVFAARVHSMLAEDIPEFANWDQDATAVSDAYHLQDPITVAAELTAACEAVAAVYAGVRADQWDRRGLRSNGSEFTVATIAVYHLHDVLHHVWDVTGTRASADG
jgi:hypothetical protein